MNRVNGGGGSVFLVDLIGGAIPDTASANPAASVTGTIDLTLSIGVCMALRVRANGNTVDSSISFYTATAAPAGDLVYQALNKDCYTAPYHVDATPWAFPAFATDALVGKLLHYVITNNGANASTYTVEMVLLGKE